ncbi:MAG: hypothetical protein B6241_09395 [Spirochaetaceae bacterium 4572_59]|nr:MAG: hypothetical protein B6241_09395 [Spirochaetaceae bacterium 4572_59]
MNREFDDAIETCLLEKLPVRKALGRGLTVLCRNLGSRDVLVTESALAHLEGGPLGITLPDWTLKVHG